MLSTVPHPAQTAAQGDALRTITQTLVDVEHCPKLMPMSMFHVEQFARRVECAPWHIDRIRVFDPKTAIRSIARNCSTWNIDIDVRVPAATITPA